MMRRFMTLLLFLLIIPLCLAEEVFVSKESIAPPPIPGAAEANSLQLTLKDFITKELVGDIHVVVEIPDTLRTIKYVDQSGILKLALEPSTYEIVLKADRLSTEGTDYYYRQSYELRQNLNETAFLMPVGSVRGVVSHRNASVPSASVKFDCPGGYGDREDIATDKYGSFSKEYLPVGHCRLLATDNSRVGEAFVDIRQGSISDVEIILNKNVKQNLSLAAILVVVSVIIILIITHFLLIRKKPAEKTKTESHKRLDDIMKTLNHREKEIVELLQKQGELTQSRIIHQTAIPKTSIVRIFENLQAKNIIELKKFGKAKKARLTDWILEKEKK